MFKISNKKCFKKVAKQSSKIANQSFGSLNHYDNRINKRVIKVVKSLCKSPDTTFSQAFNTKAERKGAYRLLSNDTLKPEKMIDSIVKGSFKELNKLKPEQVILVQDTSVISTKDFDDVGLVGPEGTSGFFFHSTICLSSEGIPLNLVGMKIFTREKIKQSSKYSWRYTPFEKKESYRWVEAINNIVPKLPDKTRPIFVTDRESDIHEYFQSLINSNASFVVRHSHNRRVITDSDEPLYVREKLYKSKVQGTTSIEIPKGHRREARVAKLNIQWEDVTFRIRSGGEKIHRERKPLSLTALRVFEENAEVKTPIEWILYTNLPVNSLKDALEILRIYNCRWRIEEFHLTLKSGMKVERNRFGAGSRIQKLLVLSTPIALRLLRLTYKSRHFPDENANKILSKVELEVVKGLIKQQRGRRPRKVTVKEAIESIGFLGGWMGRKNDGPPGVRSLWRGWNRFQERVTAVELLGFT